MTHSMKFKIETGINLMNDLVQGYGKYFFDQFKKENKKTKNKEKPPMILLCAVGMTDNEQFSHGFFDYVNDLTVDLECGCGPIPFVESIVEDKLTADSFTTLMVQLLKDYITDKLLNEKEITV